MRNVSRSVITLVIHICKFFARNTSRSTASGLRDARWHVTTPPPTLKSLSDGALVAGIERYFLASLLSLGEFSSCFFHH